MPPHRDWTRRGAGRALLYWPLVAFILVAAFPALAVPLVMMSGVTLLTLGVIGGFAGKRWRARRLMKARQAVAELADAALPGSAGRLDPSDEHPETPGPFWPTGRHARRQREITPAAESPSGGPAAEEPARRDAA